MTKVEGLRVARMQRQAAFYAREAWEAMQLMQQIPRAEAATWTWNVREAARWQQRADDYAQAARDYMADILGIDVEPRRTY